MTTNPTPPRASRRWIWALIPSLALNLAMVGLLAGLHLRAPQRPVKSHDLTRMVIGALDHQDRASIRAQMHRDMEGHKRHGGNPDQIKALIDALRQGGDDDIRRILQSDFSHHSKMRRFGADALMDRVQAMTADQRADLAARLEDRLNRQ